ncbi:hypothetical protein [Pedobacter alpinus]|uniref:Uncharacterized protein n=1 Tax=Pedobacter alpinus TaxID=1590643 RepID=A0ABW5TRU3_9SPHI
MDKVIIAVMVITFLYKMYKNFKKEMQTAAERTKKAVEALKDKVPTIATVVTHPNYKTTYDKALADDYVLEPVFDNNKQDYFKEKTKAKQVRDELSNSRKKPGYDYYNPETPAPEVIKNRAIHKPHNHNFEFPKKEKHLAADFNFRQALIYDAILRRPEY